MAWALTSSRKIFGGPDRDETASDKRNLAMYNCKFTHSGSYSAGGGTAVSLSSLFQDIHCVWQCGVGAAATAVDKSFENHVWQPVVASKNTVAFVGYVINTTNAEVSGTVTDEINVVVVGIPAVTVPASVDSVDAFA